MVGGGGAIEGCGGMTPGWRWERTPSGATESESRLPLLMRVDFRDACGSGEVGWGIGSLVVLSVAAFVWVGFGSDVMGFSSAVFTFSSVVSFTFSSVVFFTFTSAAGTETSSTTLTDFSTTFSAGRQHSGSTDIA